MEQCDCGEPHPTEPMDIEPQVVEFYTNRIDDGLADQYFVTGRIDHGRVCVTLQQQKGSFSRRPMSTHNLHMTAEEWKSLEHVHSKLQTFMDILYHDHDFGIEYFRIVGKLYADAFLVDDEPMVFLYHTKWNSESNVISQKRYSIIALDGQALGELGNEFAKLDRENQQLWEHTPCFLTPGHLKTCIKCYPWPPMAPWVTNELKTLNSKTELDVVYVVQGEIVICMFLWVLHI